ncbi:MAG: hypothetical protein ACT4P4_26870 [Betaproteobacteria bacterium]
MVRLALASAAAFALAACYNPRYPSEAPGHDRATPAPVTSGSGAPLLSSPDAGRAGILRPGFGVIESITMLPEGAAAAGGTVVSPRGYELRIRMDDGTAQSVIMHDAPTFRVGDRVEITANSLIRR